MPIYQLATAITVLVDWAIDDYILNDRREKMLQLLADDGPYGTRKEVIANVRGRFKSTTDNDQKETYEMILNDFDMGLPGEPR